MIHFNNEQACVIHLRNRNTAYVAIEGFINFKTVEKLMHSVLSLCCKENIESIIIDSSKLEVLKEDEVKWIQQEIFPHFKYLSLKRVGYVKPHNIFGDNSMRKLIPKNTNREFKEFLHLEETENWIFNKLVNKAIA